MSLWHRAPREVYRVYGEEEYLSGEDGPAVPEESVVSSWPDTSSPRPADAEFPDHGVYAGPVGPVGPSADAEGYQSHPGLAAGRYATSSPTHASRSGRIVGLGLLVGVVVITLGLIVLTVVHGSAVKPHATMRAGTDAVVNSGTSTLEGVASSDRASGPNRASSAAPAKHSAAPAKHRVAPPWSVKSGTHPRAHAPRIQRQASSGLPVDSSAPSWSPGVAAARSTEDEFDFER